jgi:hypothetical protein
MSASAVPAVLVIFPSGKLRRENSIRPLAFRTIPRTRGGNGKKQLIRKLHFAYQCVISIKIHDELETASFASEPSHTGFRGRKFGTIQP